MIRWCPLPWALSNGMFAVSFTNRHTIRPETFSDLLGRTWQSIETVSFPSFMLANLLLQPRLMIPIFIGSRLESLTESGPADPVGKWINLGAILLGISISAGSESSGDLYTVFREMTLTCFATLHSWLVHLPRYLAADGAIASVG